jgi:hypothetical protein
MLDVGGRDRDPLEYQLDVIIDEVAQLALDVLPAGDPARIVVTQLINDGWASTGPFSAFSANQSLPGLSAVYSC